MGEIGTAKVKAAAIYARISNDAEGSGLGVARQIVDCQALAERLGWVVAEVYSDNDLSAYSGKRRPAYERMLADLADGSRDAVIVYHVDRLTRRPIELEQFVAAIDAAAVRHMRFVVGDSDIMTGDGLMVVRMLAAMAANESATKSRRVRRKMEANAAEGRPHGPRPFGYEPGQMIVRESEAAIIRDWARRFLAGESLLSLSRTTQKAGLTTPKGKVWGSNSIRQILVSPRIAGLRAHRGVVVGEAMWPELITVDDHRKILARIASRSHSGRRTPRSYLLSGLLCCGKPGCGNRLYSSIRREGADKSRHIRRYVCQSGPDHGGCGRLTVVAEPLELLISDLVILRLDSPELADALAGRAAADAHTASIAEELSRDGEQLTELAEQYGQKRITMAEWLAARGPIEARITTAKRQMARATNTDALTGFVGNASALRTQWPDLPLARQNAIISAVLDHAVIGPGKPGTRGVDSARVTPVWKL